MRSNNRIGASGAVAIGLAMLPLIVMGWASYATAPFPFA